MSKLTALMADLRAHGVEALAGIDQPVATSLIVNGDIAWDDRCGAYLYVRNGGAVPLGRTHRCSASLVAWDIYIGVLRCVTVFGEGDSIPSVDTLSEEALTVMLDGEALLKMLNCDFDWTPYENNKIIQEYTLFTPNGGMAGGEWHIEVRFTAPCGC